MINVKYCFGNFAQLKNQFTLSSNKHVILKNLSVNISSDGNNITGSLKVLQSKFNFMVANATDC